MGPSLPARPLMLVMDASAALNACLAAGGFETYAADDLVAPPLMWSEARSALHEARWRGELPADAAREALERLEQAPIRSRTHVRLGREAWRIADELGWAKTYDAEYIALALLLGGRLVTLDGRLIRAGGRIVEIVSPAQI